MRHNHQQQQYRQPSNHGHSYNPRQQLHPQQRQKFLPPKPMMPAKEDRHNDTNRTSPEPRPRRTVFFPDEEEEEEEEEEKENGGWYISDDEDDDENTIDFVYENDENDTIGNAENIHSMVPYKQSQSSVLPPQSPMHLATKKRAIPPSYHKQSPNAALGDNKGEDFGGFDNDGESHRQEEIQVVEETWHADFDDAEPQKTIQPPPAEPMNPVSFPEQDGRTSADPNSHDDSSIANCIVTSSSESETLEIVQSRSVESQGSTDAVRVRRSSRHKRLVSTMRRSRPGRNGPKFGKDEIANKNGPSFESHCDLPPIPPSSSTLSVDLDKDEAQRILSARVIPLQALARGHFARKEASVRIGALLTLQRAFRTWLDNVRVEKLLRQHDFLTRASQGSVGTDVFCAIHIQRIWRGYVVRLNRENAATRIQSAWRSFAAVEQYYRDLSDIVLVQSAIRRWLGMRRHFDALERVMAIQAANATVIQSAWRAFDSSMNYLNVKLDIIIVQSVVRRWLVQQQSKRSKASYVATKRLVRSLMLRSELKRILGLRLRRHAAKYAPLLTAEDIDLYQGASLAVQTVWKRILCSIVSIQFCWRSHKGRSLFQQQRTAAISIQRGYRSLCDKRLRSATRIQACWRMVECRRPYRRTTSAIAIQAFWRKASIEREYSRILKKVTAVQSLARGRIAREGLRRRHEACLVIQHQFRCMVLRKKARKVVARKRKKLATKRRISLQYQYREKMAAASAIASFWRGYTVRSRIQKWSAAAVVIQRIVRGCQERRRYLRAAKGVCLVQSLVRKYLARTRYRNAIKNVVKIQAATRRVLASKEYLDTLADVILLQCSFRRYLQERRFRTMVQEANSAALVIQSCFRRHRAEKHFRAVIHSAVKLQRQIRRYIAEESFSLCVEATTVVQSIARMYVARSRYRRAYKAAPILHAVVRQFIARRHYLKVRAAATVVQSVWRRYQAQQYLQKALERQALRRHYLKLRAAATMIQRNWRRYQAEQYRQKALRSVVIIQSQVRRHLVEECFFLILNATIMMQTSMRLWKHQRKYNALRSATIKSQAIVRMVAARNRYLEQRNASVLLQNRWRCWVAQKGFKQMTKAATCVQRLARTYIARMRDRAATRIQSFCRMIIARSKYLILQERCLAFHRAVVSLQSNQRRKVVERRYRSQRSAAIQIQKTWRSYAVEMWYIDTILFTLTIQAAFRRHLALKRYKTATKAILVVQSSVRMLSAKCMRRNTIDAAKNIQREWRRFDLCRRNAAATIIQTNFRAYCTRSRYAKTVQNTVLIQKISRAFVERQRYQRTREAVILIQANARRRPIRNEFVRSCEAVKKIQAQVRRYFAEEDYLMSVLRTIQLQAWYRSESQRRVYCATQAIALLLQTIYRRRNAEIQYRKLRFASILLQRTIRRHQAKQSYEKTRDAAVAIQKNVRRHQAVSELHLTKAAVAVIQSSWRRVFVARKEYSSAVRIQALWRRFLAEEFFWLAKMEHSSAVTIQSNTRRHVAEKRFRILVQSTSIIQRSVRRWQVQSAYRTKKYTVPLRQLLSCFKLSTVDATPRFSIGSSDLPQFSFSELSVGIRPNSPMRRPEMQQLLYRKMFGDIKL